MTHCQVLRKLQGHKICISFGYVKFIFESNFPNENNYTILYYTNDRLNMLALADISNG